MRKVRGTRRSPRPRRNSGEARLASTSELNSTARRMTARINGFCKRLGK